VIEQEGHRLAEWETRFQSLGLLMTAPRRAILVAMSASNAPRDAVTLLLAARVHHAATSLGTVYRLLRELEHCGLAIAHAHPHKRLQWRLIEPLQADISRELPGFGDLQRMREQMQGFLRDLEKMGLAQQSVDSTERQADIEANHPPAASIFDVLRSIAGRLGYRFA
jgi:hypothetical protein